MRYMYLDPKFTVCYMDGEFSLIDISQDIFYELHDDQIEVVRLLSGEYTLETIRELFDAVSQEYLDAFLENLVQLGAIAYTEDTCKQFHMPTPRKYPELYSIHFEVTGRCNLKCEHCYNAQYAQKVDDELTTDEIFDLIKQLRDLGVRQVVLTGGEALTRQDFLSIVEEFISNRIRVSSVFSNGILLSDEVLEFLTHCGSKVNTFISLDGLTPQSHNALRMSSSLNSTDIFESAIDAIKRTVNSGLSTRINTIIHRSNFEELPNMYDYLNRLGVDCWRLAFAKGFGRYGKTRYKHDAEIEGVLQILYPFLDRYLYDYSTGRTKIDLEVEMIFRTKMLYKGIKVFDKESPCCQYHMHRCTIKPNGDVTRCAYLSDMPIGNIRSQSLETIWYSEKMQKLIVYPATEVEECKDCTYLYICGAGCRACAWLDGGSFFSGKDSQSCRPIEFLHNRVLPLIERHGFNLEYI